VQEEEDANQKGNAPSENTIELEDQKTPEEKVDEEKVPKGKKN
jgi:hypothetical protein